LGLGELALQMAILRCNRASHPGLSNNHSGKVQRRLSAASKRLPFVAG